MEINLWNYLNVLLMIWKDCWISLESVSYLDYEQCAGKYTVTAEYEIGGAQELSVKSGDVVQLVKEGDDGQWWGYNLILSMWTNKKIYNLEALV